MDGGFKKAERQMTFFIGTDEAGYGPNLGPLTITATAWRFPEGTTAPKCWQLLSDSVSEAAPKVPDQLHVADSKKVYSSSRSIEPLEKAVLSILRLQNNVPATLGELGNCVVGNSFRNALNAEPCLPAEPIGLPLKTDSTLIERSSQRLKQTLEAASAELVTIRTRVIFPTEFNQLVEDAGSKGKVLSAATLQLVAEIVRDEQPGAAEIICDKHGGRNRYGELLSAVFGGQSVVRLEEGRPISRYRMNQMEFRFQTKAEEHLPVAVASMVSKYVREVAMLEFNAWWKQLIPELKPTKGYPMDAARFLKDIEDELQRQQIVQDTIWRFR